MKKINYKILRVLIIFVLTIGFFNYAHADDAVYSWVKGFTAPTEEYNNGIGITHDSSGNVYVTGYFDNTTDFDTGAGTTNLTAVNLDDAFVSKLDSSGNLVWVKQLGGTGRETGYAVAVDLSGNVYTTGYFQGTVDFDPGAGTEELTPLGSRDIFISKLDSSGNFVWVKQLGGASAGTNVASLVLDSTGDNIFLTGTFTGTTDFDPGAGTANLVGTADPFVSKLDSSGNYVWAKLLSATTATSAASVAVDSSGNVYTTGIFTGTVDLDPSGSTANLTSAGGYDAYISKLDSSGLYVWGKQLGGAGTDSGAGIFVDSTGSNVYIVGGFNGTADFDPSGSTANLTSAGNTDIFISKLDSSGTYVWAKQLGGTGAETARAIALDTSNNVYTTGEFVSTADFDPSGSTANLTAVGSRDIFISKLDLSGDYVYAKRVGGASYQSVFSMSVDADTNIYTTGYFAGTADFDPGAGTANLTAIGEDIFILKLSPPDTTAPTITSVSSSNINNTTATISWTTNELSSSIVEYGTTTNYGTSTTETDTGTGVTSHTVSLSSLQSCTTYHYRVKSNDPSANLATSSDSTFTTPGCAAVSVVLLQQMSDAIRAQENNSVVLPPATNNNQNTQNNNSITKFIFLKNLKYKDNNTDVKELQKFLNNNNFIISKVGVGSIGNETNYFGLATRAALIKYQIANNIKPALGYFGPLTRASLNK